MFNITEKLFNTKNIALMLTASFVVVSVLIYNIFAAPNYDYNLVFALLLFELAIVLSLGLIVLSRFARIYIQRRKQSLGGSLLQRRIVVIFSLLTIIPTIIVASFSVFFFIYGVQSWFDKKISSALDNSVDVAEGYLNEHSSNLKADAYAMSKDISASSQALMSSREDFNNFLKTQGAWRVLTSAVVFRKEDVLAASDSNVELTLDFAELGKDRLASADKGEIVLVTDRDKVKALIKISGFTDTYLMVSRLVDPKVLGYMAQTKDSVAEYNILKNNTIKIQIQFVFAFIGISLIFLLTAIWFGLVFSGRIIAPIHKLIAATERVKSGDLTVRLDEVDQKRDEISTLFKAFNRMTGNLQKNQSQLVEVNKQIDQRRRLIEAVLYGVNSGIISIDENKKIRLYNKAALQILKMEGQNVAGRYIADVFPELTVYFSKIKDSPINQIFQQDIDIRREGVIYNLLIRVVVEEAFNHVDGYIITIDNISKLVNAQRMAAWSDVARRIAHEIKNPLTPLNLSAERIRKKFEAQVDDKENFNRYLDTILKHSENIEKIVKEFSEFARMPQPIMAKNNISQIIRDAVFSEKVVNSDINFEVKIPESDIVFDFDKEQINRVFINLLKNSAESLKERGVATAGETPQIAISLTNDKHVILEINDNGKGFPVELLSKITEPYVTTREKGTGLGLAIVQKIVEDHGGSLELMNNSSAEGKIIGAKVRITFLV
jgi:two-component system, NtrC family, nitrogen regulation sensor histidine kinase NtrY